MEISIEYRDSLSDQNQDKDKYSLVLANPPFKGSLDAESVSGDLLKVCKTKKTELLFLTLFLRILKIGGRCACIVPDGVLQRACDDWYSGVVRCVRAVCIKRIYEYIFTSVRNIIVSGHSGGKT